MQIIFWERGGGRQAVMDEVHCITRKSTRRFFGREWNKRKKKKKNELPGLPATRKAMQGEKTPMRALAVSLHSNLTRTIRPSISDRSRGSPNHWTTTTATTKNKKIRFLLRWCQWNVVCVCMCVGFVTVISPVNAFGRIRERERTAVPDLSGCQKMNCRKPSIRNGSKNEIWRRRKRVRRPLDLRLVHLLTTKQNRRKNGTWFRSRVKRSITSTRSSDSSFKNAHVRWTDGSCIINTRQSGFNYLIGQFQRWDWSVGLGWAGRRKALSPIGSRWRNRPGRILRVCDYT